MKSKQEIEVKVKDILKKLLSERIAKYKDINFYNCAHNISLNVKEVGRIGYCQNPEILKKRKNLPFICNDKECAKKCPLYVPAKSEEDVKKEFNEIVKNPARCGDEYPKLAALLWVLQDSYESVPKEQNKVKWYQRWFNFRNKI